MIFLIRHTKPEAPQGLCYGQTDLSLEEGWEKRAKEIQSITEFQTVQKIISSPLKRCRKLAEALSLNDKEIKIDPLLKEIDFGQWENKKWEEIDQKALIHWGNHFVSVAPPHGESFSDLYKRAHIFWEKIKKEETSLAVVTHDGIIRSILSIIMETPLEKAFSLEIPYGSLIRLNPLGRDQYRIRFL